jgi:hypothetical protein
MVCIKPDLREMGVDWNVLAHETAFVNAAMKAENVFGYCSCHN